MGRFDGDSLGAVHGGTAAEAKDDVGAELTRHRGAGADLVGRGVAADAGKPMALDTRSRERGADAVDQRPIPGLGQRGDDQAAPAEVLHDLADFVELAGAEQDSRRQPPLEALQHFGSFLLKRFPIRRNSTARAPSPPELVEGVGEGVGAALV